MCNSMAGILSPGAIAAKAAYPPKWAAEAVPAVRPIKQARIFMFICSVVGNETCETDVNLREKARETRKKEEKY